MEEKNKYSFSGKVRYSEIDDKNRLSIPSVVNYFQDCALFQSEEYGLGLDFLREKKCGWILSSWTLEFWAYPKLNDALKITTWAAAFRSFMGFRNFALEGEKGQLYARANSLWVYMDMERGRPVKPSEEEVRRYGTAPALDMEAAPRKMKLPEEAVTCEKIQVRRSQIDTNRHMNNCQYIADALEFAAEDREIVKIRTEYKKSAHYGDLIYPKLAKSDHMDTIALCNEAGEAYAIVELWYKEN